MKDPMIARGCGSELASFLMHLFSLDAADRPKHAARFRAHFIEAVRACARDPHLVSERHRWASQSYCHANGFVKLVAYASPCSRFRLRVHVWPPGCERQRLNVHNHRYAFVSLVVRGQIDDYLWRPSANGLLFKRFVYRPRNDDGYYAHEHTGNAALEIADVRRHTAGTLYSLGPGDFHYTAPVSGTSPVTFFAEDRRALQQDALTYSRHHRPDDNRVYTPALSPDRYSALLSDYVLDYIA
ncbi:hypothetical protein WKR88_16290 [Trinickia caryophylli]|uniref:Cysteine dioxygenase type I n=1 Tax=Trinickia caryophylli TaxID=28094 RepID=A0A1X7FPY9_TRICW|nr:hypothetical protein [Trinickia caryophylli]PMS09509.1 hypothetical protein C0Z17_24425 [Trinickia caryophylli]TRX14453.1 hypothetical protein FNF07_24595 [Trinickia caryophylli]WQE14290.1 hypothetical protein U0034_26785 [Trinickia caryophylli]SMF56528.1 hypothetical protein SAMN06295900_110157 [Trinickia caryophylli]GLU33196.1 hypothetical protein Busp01_30380 [Trinickia caryophylli]